MTDSPLLQAALGYAARGWPVFPCNPKNKQPLLAADKGEDGKPIRGTGGLKKASTDPEQISAWWKKWPNACIGLCCGWPTRPAEADGSPPHTNPGDPSTWPRLLVLDFDPREDPATGEVWTLERLKRETEEQLGCQLPVSLAVLTPSDGVHLYLMVGDDGPSITNRGNLPPHVDVRGLGGYVIAPPSVLSDGRRYRLHRKEPVGGISKAPEALLSVLRERGGRGGTAAHPDQPSRAAAEKRSLRNFESQPDDAVRKYALAALDGELQAVRSAASGHRNAQLNESALKIGSLVAAGALDATVARLALEAAARDNPGRDDDRQLLATIDSGWSAGMNNPRDLAEIAANARSRSERPRERQSRASGGRNPSGSQPRAQGQADHGRQPFRDGSVGTGVPGEKAGGDTRGLQPPLSEAGASSVRPPSPTEADVCRLQRIAECWLAKRLQPFSESMPDLDSLKAIAWGIGRRVSAGLLDEEYAAGELMVVCGFAAIEWSDVEESFDQGILRGFDVGPVLLDLKCAGYPLTDFGIAERFRDRFGEEFRFTTAQGWLGWDGRRWKMLDQDKDTPPAELIAAVFETIRLLQREAVMVRGTGTKWSLRTVIGPRGGEKLVIAEDEPPNPHALDFWQPKGAGFILHSEAIAIFGRQSEAAGKPGAIAALARRWLTVPIERFDCEQMAVNCLNGTLRFVSHPTPPHTNPAAGCEIEIRLDPHDRADLITRLAPVEYDRASPAPLYRAMIEWAQPDPGIRRYVHQIGGYSCSGDTGAHLLWFNYGRGRNGKSVTIDSWCSALGDYSGTIGIESFLDQGIKKRGDAATPDLAKLGGVRMLRASEPERGAKLNSALIKAATGGEPMSVRALHRGFFDLLPRFKLLMSGNSKPAIPDTDEGIWGRMRLVPWKRHIEKPDEDPYRDTYPCPEWPAKDTHLLDKIKERELAGVFACLVEGLADYLAHGFVEPEGVTLATADYRQQSDPLGRFLDLCTERDPQSRVRSSELHEVFAAWCKTAGEKEWSTVGFANAMIDKGYSKVRSDGMRWEGLRLTRQVSDFVDAEGKPKAMLPDDMSMEPARPPPEPAGSSAEDDDEFRY